MLKVNFKPIFHYTKLQKNFLGKKYPTAEVLFTANTPCASKEKNSSDACHVLTHAFPADIGGFLPERWCKLLATKALK